ncbi:GGDEF/EAL domain-containing response regulator [Plasticicumulans acidivorans]|uniref:EAL domain-containing protein (Putative c-di-GMP-specific phosphodiesterase class I) n=1 Tax=Plasticicumulans acidivorans TaxID=886464 RepID=A0A317MV40_9GAMM|nr:EAL domain-containing protein [Plasticicumulans acidivorans]PWV61788.1 EAL domain-containing protein (putative c-di-GMP-specific phosphodiesterase class I) [Plasticicumulans acidivorans]
MPPEPPLANQEPALALRDEDLAELSRLAGELRRNWQRARTGHFEAAQIVDLRMFLRELADLSLRISGAALAERAHQLDTALREAVWSGKLPEPATVQQLSSQVEQLANELSRVATTGTPPAEVSVGAPVPATTAVSQPRVYLIDSDPAQAKFLAMQLGSHGFTAESFVDWEQLTQAMHRQPPAALLADIDTTGSQFGGADRVGELRRSGKLLCPVLFLSSRNDSRAKLIALRAGGVCLFLKPAVASVIAERLSELLAEQEPLPYRVMMVDDDRAFLELQGRRLESAGFEVKLVSNPLGALETAVAFDPDVFVLDLYMPEADGCELTRLIHEEPQFQNTPIMLLSGESDPTAHARVIVAGAVDVIVKPADPVRLIERVRARAMQYRQHFTRSHRPVHKDSVAGVLSMSQFTEALEARLARPRANEGALAGLVYINLGGYGEWTKRLDTTRLEQLRERVVRAVTERQQGNDLIGWDNAGRVLVCTTQPDSPQLQSIARTLAGAIAALDFSDLGPGPAALMPSVGVCRADRGPVHDLIGSAAQLAMQQMREGGGVRLQSDLVASAAPDIEEQRRWQAIISEAAREHRLFLVYQPITNLLVADRSEWSEVLLRMRDAAGQTLLPGQFLPIAAKFGLDRLLDRWVVSRALRGLDARQQDHPGTVFFVKLGTTSVVDVSFADWLALMLSKVAVRPRSCVFQFSQSILMNHFERCMVLAQAIRALGHAVAVEHFDGTDESMARVSEFRPDFVKLERGLTQQLANDMARQRRVREVVRALKDIGASVIAAYIEDAQSLGVLWQAQVELVQGNFVQQPDEVISQQPPM